MTLGNNSLSELGLEEIVSVALVMGKLKKDANTTLAGNDVIQLQSSYRFGQSLDGLSAPSRISPIREGDFMQILQYLKNQNVIEDLVLQPRNSKDDYIVGLIPEKFNSYYESVIFLVNRTDNNQGIRITKPKVSRLPEIEFELGDFAVHKNNLISYKAIEIPLEPQVAKLVAYIMKRSQSNSYTPTEMLSDVILSDGDYEAPESYIIKIVSDARRIFRSFTNTSIDNFPNKRGRGYIFKY